jgi:hypothetical protein
LPPVASTVRWYNGLELRSLLVRLQYSPLKRRSRTAEAECLFQIPRVHDVFEAVQILRVWRGMRDQALTPRL